MEEITVVASDTTSYTWILIALVVFAALVFVLMSVIRRVVPTNMVHIVQSSKSTTPYGRGKPAGNTYYSFPSWLPKFGIEVIALPESIFKVDLSEYEAYDSVRLPFLVDVTAFFRVENAEIAAQRVSNFEELHAQLHNTLQGAVRRILATNALENIMEARASLGQQFTEEVNHQVSEWGVTTVKTIEFMDLRDTKNSTVIENIMEKEKARINKESRIAVAVNGRDAANAETDAQRDVDLRRQEAEQQVGIRVAEKEKAVGISKEQSLQEIKVQEKITTERAMEVQQVREVQTAAISKEVAIVQATQAKSEAEIKAAADKEVLVIGAEATKEATVTTAQGNKLAAELDADAIRAVGLAKGAAEQAILMAPVETQIKLATEIGSNAGYQQYLVTIKQVEAGQAVGIAMADAIKQADLKIISSGAQDGNITKGVAGLADMFTPAGGTKLTGMLAALSQTDEGKALLGAVTNRLTGDKPSAE